MDERWLWAGGLGLLGLIFGSFLATVAVRAPEGRDATRGRSACDACAAPLSARELVPLLSYALLRGRCARCGARISGFHPVMEALGLLIGAVAGALAPGLEGVAGAVFGWQLLLLAALDLRAFWLPNWGTGALALSGLAAGLAGLAPDWGDRLIGGAAGFGLLWLAARGYRAWRGREGLGGGDPKLMGAIGLWLGWAALPMLLLVASLTGLGVVAAMMAMGRAPGATTRLPFGIMLAVAGFALWCADKI